MRIDVEGERNIRVSQKLLNVFDVYALLQQEGGAGVPEIVKACGPREPNPLQGDLEMTLQVTGGERRTYL